MFTFEILDCGLISNIWIWTSGGPISKLDFNDHTKSFYNAHLDIKRVEIGHGVETVQHSKGTRFFLPFNSNYAPCPAKTKYFTYLNKHFTQRCILVSCCAPRIPSLKMLPQRRLPDTREKECASF